MKPSFFAIAATAAILALPAPSLAQTDTTPPGDPCGDGPGVGTGNPCNGNNGNTGANGNAGGFEFEEIEVTQQDDRGAFISQIGSGNQAGAEQQGSDAYARIIQSGERNSVDLRQDNGNHYAEIAQDGDGNSVLAGQDGSGQSVLLLVQQGSLNTAELSQFESGSLYSAAAVSQSGSGNLLNLVQDGSDNQARLTQSGDNNAMSATQLGDGNRLDWTQQGNGLSDLQITQEGGQAMQITQTNTGGSPGGN